MDSIEQLEIRGMDPGCHRETVTALCASECFSIEEDTINEAVRAITEYQLTLVLEVRSMSLEASLECL